MIVGGDDGFCRINGSLADLVMKLFKEWRIEYSAVSSEPYVIIDDWTDAEDGGGIDKLKVTDDSIDDASDEWSDEWSDGGFVVGFVVGFADSMDEWLVIPKRDLRRHDFKGGFNDGGKCDVVFNRRLGLDGEFDKWDVVDGNVGGGRGGRGGDMNKSSSSSSSSSGGG